MTAALLLSLTAGLTQDVSRIPGQPFALEVREERTVVVTVPRDPDRGFYFGEPEEEKEERVLPPDSINPGSSLQRVVFAVNFDDSPVRVTDASADFVSLDEIEPECLPDADEGRGFLERLFTEKPDCDSYAEIFVQSFTAETVAVSEVAAVEVRFITLDYFGDFLRDVRGREAKDYSGRTSWGGALANHDDIYRHLTTIVFINRVTLLDGSSWSVDDGALLRIIRSLNINVDLEHLEQEEPDIPVPFEGSYDAQTVIGLVQHGHRRGGFSGSDYDA